MPLKWDDHTKGAPVKTGAFSFSEGAPPARELVLWPHRSLPRRGFAIVILAAYGMLLIPLFALIGSHALWGLLPFVLGVIALLWFFLERSYHSGRLTEVLRLWDNRVELIRTNPDGSVQDWHANPHWVRINMHPKGPVENYVTLTGGGREVEIGAFLSPEERVELYHDLMREIR